MWLGSGGSGGVGQGQDLTNKKPSRSKSDLMLIGGSAGGGTGPGVGGKQWWRGWGGLVAHFLALAELRGGVTGRPAGFNPLNCPYLPLFLSAGFKIWGGGEGKKG